MSLDGTHDTRFDACYTAILALYALTYTGSLNSVHRAIKWKIHAFHIAKRGAIQRTYTKKKIKREKMRMNMMDKKKQKPNSKKSTESEEKKQEREKNEAKYSERRNDDSIYSSIWMIYFI